MKPAAVTAPRQQAGSLREAMARHAAGDRESAYPVYLAALARQPGNVDLLYLAGSIDYDCGRHELAVERSRKVAQAEGSSRGWGLLGIALKACGEIPAAIEALEKAVDLAPTDADMRFNLANAYRAAERADEAVASYLKALEVQPGHQGVMLNLGTILTLGGRAEEGLVVLEQLLRQQPDHPDVLNMYGGALTQTGKPEAAIPVLRRANALAPRHHDVPYNLGVALQAVGDYTAAAKAFRKAVERDPANDAALINLGNFHKYRNEYPEALDHYRRARDIGGRHEASAWSNVLFTLEFVENLGEADIAAERSAFGARYDSPRTQPFTHDRDPSRRLRLGYVSADFRHHAASRHFLPIMERHDRDLVEVFIYNNHSKRDAITDRCEAAADHVRQVHRLSDQALADLVEEDGIDVLVDLSGHTAGNRLPMFALKPAPVQISWIGYVGSTGLRTMDYYIGVASLPRPEDVPSYTEEVIRLTNAPAIWASNDLPDPGPAPALENGYVTFGSFNKIEKISATAASAWGRILAAIPDARLLLKTVNLSDPAYIAEQTARLTACGVPGDRLIIEQPSEMQAYLQRYGAIDIALDPFPFRGATTTIDTLRMGVPLVTLEDTGSTGGFGAAFMRPFLPELIASSVDDYVRIAVAWAGDIARLNAIRPEIAAYYRQSMNRDPASTTREFEAVVRDLWGRWCRSGSTTRRMRD